MPLLTLIFNQFTAHVQEHRVRKYENISDSYCWLILCECDVFINLMTPRSKGGPWKFTEFARFSKFTASEISAARCKRRDHKRVSEVTGLDSDLIGGWN